LRRQIHDYVKRLVLSAYCKITLAHAMGEAEKDLPELLERKCMTKKSRTTTAGLKKINLL